MSTASAVRKRLRPTPWAQLSSARKVRRVVGVVSQIGLLGMGVSAMTSENEVGLRADGSLAREHRGETSIHGDPKVKAQRDQAGEAKDSTGSGDTEAQSGNAADDTAAADTSS